mgnify:CR=1 FL=1
MKKTKSKKATQFPPPLSAPDLVVALVQADPIVRPYVYCYRVDFGPDFHPGQKYHYVWKDKTCTCTLNRSCPAVGKVASYLAEGGQRADDPPADYWVIVPTNCPVCSSAATSNPSLTFPGHGMGWQCSVGGTEHYWQARAAVIVRAQREVPRIWLFPPRESGGYVGVTVEDYVESGHGVLGNSYLEE